jgi:hypothetical protein
MKSLFHKFNFLLAACVFMCFGCYSRTEITGTAYFPINCTRDNFQYRAFVVSDGAYGREYSDRTKKTVTISIKAQNRDLFKKEYKFVAGNLDWEFIWPSAGNLRIRFYERDKNQNEKDVKVVELALDPNENSFFEVNLK